MLQENHQIVYHRSIIPTYNKALQRRDIRVSKTFNESRSSGVARHCIAMAACPWGLSRSDWGFKALCS